MQHEIDSLEQFDAWASAPTGGQVAIQAVDLSERDATLRRIPVQTVMFLGCELRESTAQSLRARGALVFPTLPDVPFDIYRNGLHTCAELYAGLETGYETTPDARIYAWSRTPEASSLRGTLAQALHDHAISDALDELVEQVDDARCIGIMGGHAARRGGETYRQAALLGARLAQSGRIVMTGGGPGAMEAGNLGARLHRDPAALEEALLLLAEVPSFTSVDEGGPGITAWARQAMAVCERFPDAATSVGIPTWFYGHEPPNPFATHIAKYFSNAIREDILLRKCRGGIIYLTGAAGTVQEVFQAATGNYYTGSGIEPAPMVLVGVEHWTRTIPAWPLLQALGHGRAMGEHIHLVDTVEEAWQVLVAQA